MSVVDIKITDFHALSQKKRDKYENRLSFINIDVLSISYISNYFAIQIVTRFIPFSEYG